MRARLGAYAGVQLRDFLVGRFPLLVIVTCVVTGALLRVSGVSLAAFDPSAGIGGREQAQRAFADALGVYALMAAVFTAQGLVARDRWRGFDRVLFSRPLSPVRYYLQAFAVAGVAIVGFGIVAAGLFTVAVRPVGVAGVAGFVALAWLSVGAFAFALSALTTYHLPLVVGLLGASVVLGRFVDGGAAQSVSPALAGVQYLLPPVPALLALREPLSRGRFVGVDDLAWPIAFGVLCLSVAVLVLSRRPTRS